MNILIVDSSAEDSAYIKELIVKHPQKKLPVLTADSLEEAGRILSTESVILILYDLQMNTSEDGEELDSLILSYPHIPLISLTSLGNEEKGTKTLCRGCADYLVKGVLRGTGLLHAIEKALVFHSTPVKTEHLGLYAEKNLDALKKVLLPGEKAGIHPNSQRICKKLEKKIKQLDFEETFTLFLYQRQGDCLILAAHNHHNIPEHEHPPVHAHEQSIMFQSLRMKHPLKAGNLHETLQRSTKEQVYIDDDTLCVPLLRGHEGIGVLNLNSYKGPRYDPGFLIKFKMLLYFLTREIKNYFISRDIEELSLSDELTGLYNRRYLLWELNREIKRVQRYRGTLSILYINIENFKIVNDTYGYKTGDLLLTLISHQLKKLMRTTDFIGRYEGEKFIAMLTETDHKGAAVLHKRIIHRISNKDFDIGGKTPVNIKVKVYNAEYDFKIKNGSEFIEHIKTLAEKEEEQKQTPDSPASTETRGPGKKEISREPGTVPQKKDAGERAAPSHARNVHVYFIEPLELISVVIDTLVKMGFESYQVDLKDKMKLLQILDKEIRNVIFICISSESDLASWFEYINHIQKLEDDNIQVGIFAYSRINPGYCMKFLERNIAVIKFSDIQADTVSVLKKILIYFEAKGRRGYVRVEACDDSSAFINLDSEHLVIKARIHTISEQFFTCYFEKKDLHHLVQGRYFTKVLLRLKGTVVQISTKILTTKKDDPRYCVMQICSALYKNKRITYTSSLKKETKDKIHRYIRYCLKENLKKRLLSL